MNKSWLTFLNYSTSPAIKWTRQETSTETSSFDVCQGPKWKFQMTSIKNFDNMYADNKEIEKRHEIQWTMALPQIASYEKKVKNKNNTGKASTFYEKLFKLLYLMLLLFFFFTQHCDYVLKYKSECRIKCYLSLILTFNVGAINSLAGALCKQERKKLKRKEKICLKNWLVEFSLHIRRIKKHGRKMLCKFSFVLSLDVIKEKALLGKFPVCM